MKSLCVEGWRFLSHSYALVNQWQLMSLAKRPGLALSVRDVPYIFDHWRQQRGQFHPAQEGMLAAIPILSRDGQEIGRAHV